MPVDLAAWVKGLGLPEDKSKSVLEAIGSGGESALKYIETNQLRQDEFSRKMNDLQTDVQKRERELATKIENEDRYHNSLATWDTKRKKELSDATTARQRAEAALASARDKVLALAAENDLPADEISKLFEGAPVTASTNTPTNTGPDTKDLESRFVTVDTFRGEAKAYARLATMIPTIERQHFKLFGDNAEAPNWESLIEKTIETKGAKTLKQVYEEEYKVPEKREELRNAQHQADIDKARKEGEDAGRAKILADNPTLGQNVRSADREGSPVLALATRQAAKAAEGKPVVTPSTNPVQAAVAAFNSGKYKVEGTKAA